MEKMNQEGFIGQLAIKVRREKVDAIDRKILYLLSLNARLSNTSIANHLKLSREMVAYRINRMQNSNILHGFLTLVSLQKTGIHSKSVGIKLHTAIRTDELLADLKKLPAVTKITHCGGLYDLHINIMERELEDCYDTFHNIIFVHGHRFKLYEIATILGEEFLGLGMLVENKKEQQYLNKINEKKGSSFQEAFRKQDRKTTNRRLDELDERILKALQHQARIPLTELSSMTGISVFQLGVRIRQLIHDGIIKGFIPYLSLAHLGLQFNFVLLNVKKDVERKFSTWVAQHPYIVWKTKYLGAHNYKLSIFVKNNAHLSDVLNEIYTEFNEGVGNVESLPVFESPYYKSFMA